MDEIGVLRDMYPAQSFDGAKAHMAARELLGACIATEGGKATHRALRPVIWRAKKPALVSVVVAVAALALVPVGGANLGARAVDGIVNIWATPVNQPALDAAATDAQSIAGSAYYTEARVDDAANSVDVYLASAPQSVIEQLEAAHPGTYVIHNDAAHPLSQLLQLQHSLPSQAGGARIVASYPTPDGHLKVGVEGSDVQAAQSELDSLTGPGVIEVFGDAQPIIPFHQVQTTPHVKRTHR